MSLFVLAAALLAAPVHGFAAAQHGNDAPQPEPPWSSASPALIPSSSGVTDTVAPLVQADPSPPREEAADRPATSRRAPLALAQRAEPAAGDDAAASDDGAAGAGAAESDSPAAADDAGAGDVGIGDAVDDDAAAAEEAEAGGETGQGADSPIRVLGEGSMVLYLVDHSPLWSMHVENVPADVLFRLWRGAGGPEVLSKQVLDHPFTMSVHKLSPERIVARVLDGFNYTLQYRAGRLASVHVISALPTRVYKTPRLVQSRSKWTETELSQLAVTQDAASSGPGIAEPEAVVAPPSGPADQPVPALPARPRAGSENKEPAGAEAAPPRQRIPHRGAP
ncbi:MAG TPA: hypothetical protein VEC57_13745 [Candidatus Limnocylindrales bacterium]|nr:hypothetical protein [Candidatus Limnocylindrales bacterium]